MSKSHLDQEKENKQDQDQDQEKDQEQEKDQDQDQDQDQETSRSRRHILQVEDEFDQRELRSLLSSLGPKIKVIVT